MADEGFKRKLAAILSADVADYSRLMAEDLDTEESLERSNSPHIVSNGVKIGIMYYKPTKWRGDISYEKNVTVFCFIWIRSFYWLRLK